MSPRKFPLHIIPYCIPQQDFIMELFTPAAATPRTSGIWFCLFPSFPPPQQFSQCGPQIHFQGSTTSTYVPNNKETLLLYCFYIHTSGTKVMGSNIAGTPACIKAEAPKCSSGRWVLHMGKGEKSQFYIKITLMRVGGCHVVIQHLPNDFNSYIHIWM